jgi:hypothetical protein
MSIPADEAQVRCEPEQAWKVLLLVNELLKHAETKLAAVLTAAGVAGGGLFGVVRGHSSLGVAWGVLTVTCGVAVIAAGGFAMAGLSPVVSISGAWPAGEFNPLFFADIEAHAAIHGEDAYVTELADLSARPELLVRHIGQQICANSAVVRRKYRWASRAVRALALALSLLAVTAAVSTVAP